jgi:tRNA-specific 2-thiouridylase
MAEIGAGEIVNESGEVVGEHSGYTDYTIGQRKGLGLSTPEPRYVSNIDPTNNQIRIGKKGSLSKNNCEVSGVNWLVENISFPCDVQTQIRYNSPVIDAKISQSENQFSVQFLHPQIAVTPGQSIVFYKDDIVLGGGIIEKNIE